MYSSRIADSSHSDHFAAMICPHDHDYIVTERGSFKARSTLFTLGHLVAQQACESLCRISHFECTRIGIVFLTTLGQASFGTVPKSGMTRSGFQAWRILLLPIARPYQVGLRLSH
jgi:hypothetical protein